MKPRLLDLFCGAGGCTKGYQRAGFYVVGVDLEAQPYYCGDAFRQMDALTCLRALLDGGSLSVGGRFYSLADFAAIHASPPCQFFTLMSNRSRAIDGLAASRVDLLTPTLELLRPLQSPWVVENVVGAEAVMRVSLKLHGGMFGLRVNRPRLFESNVLLMTSKAPFPTDRVGVYGRAPDGRRLWGNAPNGTLRAAESLEDARDAMGMDWADWHGTKEAIPPAYTELIGHQLMQYLRVAA